MRHKVKCGHCGRWAEVKGEVRTIERPTHREAAPAAQWPTDVYILECPSCGLSEQPMDKRGMDFAEGLRSVWTRAVRGFMAFV